jgi:hypothetical protein
MKRSHVFLIFAVLALAAAVGSYPPLATTTTAGLIKPDGTTCTTSAGVLTCSGSSTSGVTKLCDITSVGSVTEIDLTATTCGATLTGFIYYELFVDYNTNNVTTNDIVVAQLSADNGSTYDTTAGDYASFEFDTNATTVGTPSQLSIAGIGLMTAGSGQSRTLLYNISNGSPTLAGNMYFDGTAPTCVNCNSFSALNHGNLYGYYKGAITNANAIRIITNSGGGFSAIHPTKVRLYGYS